VKDGFKGMMLLLIRLLIGLLLMDESELGFEGLELVGFEV